MKFTKSSLRWVKKNNEKVDVLRDYGLDEISIKIIGRFIGSSSHDKKEVCEFCGHIYSKKLSKQNREKGQDVCLSYHMDRCKEFNTRYYEPLLFRNNH